MDDISNWAVRFSVALVGLMAGMLVPAAAGNSKYGWMLPKTVLDVTATYTFEDCTEPVTDRNGSRPQERSWTSQSMSRLSRALSRTIR